MNKVALYKKSKTKEKTKTWQNGYYGWKKKKDGKQSLKCILLLSNFIFLLNHVSSLVYYDDFNFLAVVYM